MEGNNDVKKGDVSFVEEEDEAVDEQTIEAIKERIKAHPRFGLLMESHFNCLKVGLCKSGEVGSGVTTTSSLKQGTVKKPDSTHHSVSADLDHFMEEYCMTLGKLKEAMEKPIQETESFINSMYAQLSDLSDLSELSGTNPTTCSLPPLFGA